MTEWTVQIETEPKAAWSAADLDTFSTHLHAGTGVLGDVASLDMRSGAVHATFSVEATSAVEAVVVGISRMVLALGSSGMPTGIATVSAAPS